MVNEVKEFLIEVVADGCIIGSNPLGIVEVDGDFPIVPKNLMVSFDTYDECVKNEECSKCEYGGTCHNVLFEIATVSKIGGRQSITFVRWIEHQIGAVYTKWQRNYNL